MVLFTGKTVEEAIQTGLKELNIPRIKAHIKVISKETKGFLGFFRKPAQVDVEVIDEPTIHKANRQAVKGVPDVINKQNEPVTSTLEDTVELGKVVAAIKQVEQEGQTVAPEVKEQLLDNKKAPESILAEADQGNVLDVLHDSKVNQSNLINEELTEDTVSTVSTSDNKGLSDSVSPSLDEDGTSKDIMKASEDVASYVEKIIYEMDLEATLAISHNRRHINIQIETPEAGRVIGYHGKVLKSLQLLAQNYLHDRYSKNFSVSLNVHDYVEHRTEILIEFSKKIAQRVLESGRDYAMDPMSNSERKVVHKTITKIDGVESYSEGDDPNRYVVVTARGDY